MRTTGGTFILGEVHNVREGTSLKTQVFMDQGNCIGPGIGMSEDFFKRMNLVYADEVWDNLKTASTGSNLTKLDLGARQL